MLHHDRSRAESFGNQADRYDRSRPSYPPELLDAVLGPSAPGCRVLDVGCGTGIAARQLAARGAEVTGVEIDPRMAEVASRHALCVELGAFEDWDPKGRRFDRVTAAQAWHWVDPVRGAAKAASVLEPSGRLCAFWNHGHRPPDLAAELDETYRRLAPEIDPFSVLPSGSRRANDPVLGHRGELEAMAACDELGEPVIEHFSWARTYDATEWIDQLATHSDHATLPAERLAPLLDAVASAIGRLGGAFEMRYTTLLLSAPRR